MMSPDKIHEELNLIKAFDHIFIAQPEHTSREIISFEFRQLRVKELMLWAEAIAANN